LRTKGGGNLRVLVGNSSDLSYDKKVFLYYQVKRGRGRLRGGELTEADIERIIELGLGGGRK